MVMNVREISQKIKNKNLMIIEKYIIEWEKIPYYKSNDLESSFEAINVLQKTYLKKKFGKYV